MSRKTKCSALKEMVRNMKLISIPSLKQSNKEKNIAWTDKYIKQTETRVTLDGLDYGLKFKVLPKLLFHIVFVLGGYYR